MGIKLLIADDEDIIRKGIAKYIKLHTDRFDSIFTAENGEEALEIIFRYQPEIILLDIQMARKNGLEVLAEMHRCSIPGKVVVLSGYDEFSYAQQALRYKVKEYLLKPVRSMDILELLHRMADEEEGKKPSVEKLTDSERNGIVESAREYVKEHYFENLTLGRVAERVGITPGYLSTLFSKNLECGFVEYLNKVRIEYACIYLRQNYFKVYEIAYKVGFRDEKYFTRVFRRQMGMAPSEFRKNVRGG